VGVASVVDTGGWGSLSLSLSSDVAGGGWDVTGGWWWSLSLSLSLSLMVVVGGKGGWDDAGVVVEDGVRMRDLEKFLEACVFVFVYMITSAN